MWSEVERAYLAGLIDGDGFFTIGFTCGVRASGREWGHGYCRIGIKMSDPRAVEWVHRVFGGRLSSRLPAKHEIGWRRQWLWQVTSRAGVLGIADAIRPFLILKRAQADCVIDYHAGFVNLQSRSISEQVRAAEKDRRASVHRRLRLLNDMKGDNARAEEARRLCS